MKSAQRGRLNRSFILKQLNAKTRYLLDNKLHIIERQLRRQRNMALLKRDYKTYDVFSGIYNRFTELNGTAPLNYNMAKQRRVQRIKKRVGPMVLSGNGKFVTITFDDKALEVLTAETRRRYVIQFLNSQSNQYIANLDYGKEKGREHYHAIVNADAINANQWPYGFIDVKKINTEKSDLAKVAKYLNKISQHAVKETASAPRLIYSKNMVV